MLLNYSCSYDCGFRTMLHIIHYGKPKVHEIEEEMVMTYRKILAVELLFDSANKVKVCPSKTNTGETDKPRDQMESSRGEKPLDKSLDSEKVRSPSPKTGGSEKLSDENTKEPSVSTSSSPPEVQDDEDKSHSSPKVVEDKSSAPKVDKDKQPPGPKPKSESVRMGRDKEIPHAIGTWSMRTRKNNKVCATEVTQYTCIQPNRERNKSASDIISDSKLKG